MNPDEMTTEQLLDAIIAKCQSWRFGPADEREAQRQKILQLHSSVFGSSPNSGNSLNPVIPLPQLQGHFRRMLRRIDVS